MAISQPHGVNTNGQRLDRRKGAASPGRPPEAQRLAEIAEAASRAVVGSEQPLSAKQALMGAVIRAAASAPAVALATSLSLLTVPTMSLSESSLTFPSFCSSLSSFWPSFRVSSLTPLVLCETNFRGLKMSLETTPEEIDGVQRPAQTFPTFC